MTDKLKKRKCPHCALGSPMCDMLCYDKNQGVKAEESQIVKELRQALKEAKDELSTLRADKSKSVIAARAHTGSKSTSRTDKPSR